MAYKKLISILAAIGLTTTASSAVVSCSLFPSSSKKDNAKASVDVDYDKDTKQVHVLVELIMPEDMSPSDVGNNIQVFDNKSHGNMKARFMQTNQNILYLNSGQKYYFNVYFKSDPDHSYAIYAIKNHSAGNKLSEDFNVK